MTRGIIFWAAISCTQVFTALGFAEEPSGVGFEALGAIPEGVESRGVVKPSFSEGVLRSLIKAATVTKVSNERLDMSEMTLQMKGKTASEDVEVALLSASYDLPTKVLTSDEHSVVRRSDFVIEGDSLVFDTGKSVGKMIGNVTMVIDLPKQTGDSATDTNPKSSNQR